MKSEWNIRIIWKKLLVEEKRIVSRQDIEPLCSTINKRYDRVIHYLQKQRLVVRIFREIFYVKDPGEMEQGFHRMTPYEMVANALPLKGVEKWYFGLETALKFNNMTHEYFSLNYVITDSYRTTKVIKIMDFDFKFIKWGSKRFGFGLKKKDTLIYSDREKTMIDMIYKRFAKRSPSNKVDREWVKSLMREYGGSLDKKKIDSYIEHYPRWMGDILWILR